MTLEQQGFELQGSAYMWGFVCFFCLFVLVVNITVRHDPKVVESTDSEPWIGRANYKIVLKLSTTWRVSIRYPWIKGQLYLGIKELKKIKFKKRKKKKKERKIKTKKPPDTFNHSTPKHKTLQWDTTTLVNLLEWLKFLKDWPIKF